MKNKILKLALSVVAAFVATASALHSPRGSVCAANTYDAATEVHEASITRTNDAAISSRHLLHKAGAAATSVDICGASDIPIGPVDNTESSTGVRMSVLLLGKGTTKKVVASEAITYGEAVFTAASGKVQDLPAGAGTYYQIGYALVAAAADGDIIEIQDHAPVKTVVA